MDCKKPVRLNTGLLVPCGQCLACRIQKRREWTLRCIHELEVHNNEALFITLTYSDDFIPAFGSLNKKHLQDFFKKLRKRLDKDGKKIRYFASGEYGDETQRPHYHAIIFGLEYNISDTQLVRSCWPYCDWSNPSIRVNSFGLAEPDSIRYVCQYVDKKFTGALAKKEYDEKNRSPVFKLSSQGIGRGYVDKHYKDIKTNMRLTLNGVNHSIPRYYIQRLDLDISAIQEKAEINNNKRFKKLTGKNAISRDSSRNEITDYYDNINLYNKKVSSSRVQHDLTLKAKLNLKRKKL